MATAKKITIHDVALAAGVSVSTVSLVLSGKGRISTATGERVNAAIEELGFENPMPVQEEVIPYLLGNKNDVIALAQTGTGKTAAYGLPVVQKTDATDKTTQAVILSPTRELCLQIADDLNAFSKYIAEPTSARRYAR